MNYTIIFEKITDSTYPAGFYYAHLPTLDLTTHGLGIEGARESAKDLVKLWIEEKIANGEPIKSEAETFISNLEIEDALFS